jgi:hypothetical protein
MSGGKKLTDRYGRQDSPILQKVIIVFALMGCGSVPVMSLLQFAQIPWLFVCFAGCLICWICVLVGMAALGDRDWRHKSIKQTLEPQELGKDKKQPFPLFDPDF